jgi:hypothetical protein
MARAQTPAQIRQLIKKDQGIYQKIRRKSPKFNPNVDKRNSNRNKLKESYGGEGV